MVRSPQNLVFEWEVTVDHDSRKNEERSPPGPPTVESDPVVEASTVPMRATQKRITRGSVTRHARGDLRHARHGTSEFLGLDKVIKVPRKAETIPTDEVHIHWLL